MDINKIYEIEPLLRPSNEEKFLVIGDDIDAYLSAALFIKYNPNTRIIGFYEGYKSLYLIPDYKSYLDRTIWLDLDIYDANCFSLGHHIVRKTLKDQLPKFKHSCNLNELQYVYLGNFSVKYPLGTIHFLIALYKEVYEPGSDKELLIWLADSTYINGQAHRFRANVGAWIKTFLTSSLLELTFNGLDDLRFESRMQSLYSVLLNQGFKQGHGQVASGKLHLSGFQFQSKFENSEYLKKVSSLISKITTWPDIYSKIVAISSHPLIAGTRASGYMIDLLQGETLDVFLEANEVFSYVIPNSGKINYTTGIKL